MLHERRRHHLHESVLQRAVQEAVHRRDTTMIYTQVLNRGWGAVRTPADCLLDKEAGTEPRRGVAVWA